jgi:hypothetical protein
MSGEELYLLCKGRRLEFAHEDYNIHLLVHTDMWETERHTWVSVADTLNTWSVGDQVRENLASIKDELIIVPLSIPTYLREDDSNLLEV